VGGRAVQLFLSDADASAGFKPKAGECDFADEPGIAELYMLAAALMEFLGPVFWAALIVLFIWVELTLAFAR
jgi:hypothetical protein